MEIERKFLVNKLPEDLLEYPSVSIEQGYVIVTADKELRIRKRGEAFWLTFKKGSGTTRDEIEIGISKEQYHDFKTQIVGSIINKKRINYPYHRLTIEIDIYKGSLEGLVVAEVEFPSKESMNKFSEPEWFAEEISLSAEFKNKNLASQGFPPHLLLNWKDESRPPWHYNQSGVIPFRKSDTGYEVLLITTRKSGKWILPKGIVEPDLSPADSAGKEALEEAGVSGTVIDGIQESYSFDKWNGRCTVALFPLEVTKTRAHWAEENVRKRKWVPRERVDDHIESPELIEAILTTMDQLIKIEE